MPWVCRRVSLPANDFVFPATVAQSVEQLTRNEQVAGSNPASSSKIKAQLFGWAFIFVSMR